MSHILDRNKALSWWNTLSLEEQFYQVIPWLKSQGMNVTDRHPDLLTGREIESLHKIKQDDSKS